MGRIGKSYPRFKQNEQDDTASQAQQRSTGFHALGAIVGLLAALGVIGFFLTR